MKRTRSDRSVERVLEKLRKCRRPALMYGMASEQGERWFLDLAKPILRAMESYIRKHTARCCVLELCRHYRKLYGAPLAEHLALSIAKYQDMGLSRYTVEQLVVVIDEAVGPRSEAGNASAREK